MLDLKDFQVIVLLEGALTNEMKVDTPTVSTLKGVGLKFAALPGKELHPLQDGVIAELRAYKQHTLQVISERKINNLQMTLQ